METGKELIKGAKVALRLWDETNVHGKKPSKRPYETVGYVLDGTATLEIEGKKQMLKQGDSYHVPAEAEHTYDISGHFRCIEATSV